MRMGSNLLKINVMIQAYSLVPYVTCLIYITKQQSCTSMKKTDVHVYSMHAFACLCMDVQLQPQAHSTL